MSRSRVVLALVLCLISVSASAATRTWTGAVNNLWSNAGNWSGGFPVAGDTLVFHSGSANKVNTNDLTPGISFYRIDVGSGYTISGNGVGIVFAIVGVGASTSSFLAPVRVDDLGAYLQDLTFGPVDTNGKHSNQIRSIFTGNVSGNGTINPTGSSYTATSSYSGSIGTDGAFFVSGVLPAPVELNHLNGTAVPVQSGLLRGTGTVGNVTVGSRLAPGGTNATTDTPGVLTTGNLSIINGRGVASLLILQLNGTTRGTAYDGVNVNGTVTLTSASLQVTYGYTPLSGDTFLIVNNDGADPVSGTFHNLPEGAIVPQTNPPLRVSYVGGDGNDITLTVVPGTPAVHGDYDGDTIADFGVFRSVEGDWHIASSGGAYLQKINFGAEDDQIVPGVYDGDSKTDYAYFHAAAGLWQIAFSSGAPGGTLNVASQAGDIGVPADYDGDGRDDVAWFRPGQGGWYINYSNGGTGTVIGWGMVPTDVPVPADYDGDGKADIAVFRRSEGGWHILKSSGGTTTILGWGFAENDIPVPADYDGDGKADIAIFRPIEGGWHIIRSTAGNYTLTGFGVVSGDVPVPADYSGDGIADIAVFRPNEGGWHVFKSSGGFFTLTGWGMHPADIPLTKAPRP